MNDVELKALELKRKAWEVLDANADVEVLFQELYRLERQTPEFFEEVAKQLEADNGRWAASSALPNAAVKREAGTTRIEEISFHALLSHTTPSNSHTEERTEFQHVAVSKTAAEEMNRTAEKNTEPLSVIVWRSDYGDRAWIEDFAKDYIDEDKKTT